jgi:ribonuclease BN (tRNA processing enzyme)
LIITHFSARYTDRGAEITVSDLLNETKQRLAELDSAVVAHAADDFWEFEIPEKKAPPLQPANPANTNQP